MTKSLMMMYCVLLIATPGLATDPSVHLQPANLRGSRPLEKQTETSVVRDYLQSWKSLQQALEENQVAKLDPDFIGTAHDKIAATIAAQSRSGIHTRYEDRSHDLQVVFYSPEGLSIQMTDDVEYEQKVFSKDKVLVTKIVHAHYLVVMTPSETRWQVRVLQATTS